MDFWTAIVLIVAVGVVSEMYQARIKARGDGAKFEKGFETLSERMTRLEERMANLETIVLEHEKENKFTSLSR